MPIISGLSTSQTRYANTAFAATFFSRAMRSMWPRICGTTKSSAEVEPFAFLGAAPLLKLFTGMMQSQGVASFSLQVPNPVYKSIETFRRSQFEFDQTRTLSARVGMLGVKVSQHWDYLLANRILKASTAGSQNFTDYESGKTYTMTLDGQPSFSASHNTGNPAVTQSNIVQGHLPTTIAALNAQDMGVSATQMQLDIAKLIQQISTVVDDKGALVLPDFDPARQLTLIVPPALWAVAELAFKLQGGILGGTSGSSAGSSSSIGYRMVKDVIAWNLLTACPDVESDIPGKIVSPLNPTEYYAFITDGDFVKPWYFQRFMPIPKGETVPFGEDPQAQAAAIIASANTSGLKVTPEAADVYAATEIDHNLSALGSSAQESTVMREEFFVAARTRGMIFPGPWFTGWKIDPTGTSN